MIIGMGVDIIEIERFKTWRNFAKKQLQHVFSEQEIVYCLSNEIKSAERFAARFAARESFFKAISAFLPPQTIHFATVCRQVEVVRDEGGSCRLVIDWQSLNLLYLASCTIHLSLSHNHSQAIAVVILER